MKYTGYMAAVILLALGTTAASAQSLGDYARSVRKTQPRSRAAAGHHYDNDNLPREAQLNVVGPPPSVPADEQAGKSAQPDGAASANASEAAAGANPEAPKNPKDDKAAADERKRAADDLQKKLDAQKQKVESLNHEIDLQQREYKLRAASFYADAGLRLRNSGQWDKDDAKYRQEMADKQKALDAAKADLEAQQEAARKAGIHQKDDQ